MYFCTEKSEKQGKKETTETDLEVRRIQRLRSLELLCQERELVFPLLEFGLTLTLALEKECWEVTPCITDVLLERGRMVQPELGGWRGGSEENRGGPVESQDQATDT